jgi:aminopeptidase YwaD
MKKSIFILIMAHCFISKAQDTNYVRYCLKYLCSETCFGRGYLKKGLSKASEFIVSELKKSSAAPLFTNGYYQAFYHSVNTFPKKCEVKLNGVILETGMDYILDASSSGGKGKCTLLQKDSVTYLGNNKGKAIQLKLQKKLTFSVSDVANSSITLVEIDKARLKSPPQTIEWNIENKIIKNFESKNIGAYFKGTQFPDSFVVFTAHYDHLGGIGKYAYFPGANDNGAGISGVLDLVTYYKKNPPKYSIVFIFFAGEEAGLLGSNYFVENSPINLNKIKFLINLDLIGTGDEGITVVNATEFKQEFENLKAINQEKQLLKLIKPRGKAANSDHYWFSEKGVHCFFIYTMGGISAYHDVLDKEKTLPLTDYVDLFKLLTRFVEKL